MKLNIFFALIFFGFVALAGPSSNTFLKGQFLKNGTSAFTIPSSGGPDQLVMRTSTDTLTNKSIDAGTNTITNIGNSSLAAGAVIDFSKLHSLTSAHLLVGSAGNVATDTAVTGDIAITNAGVTSYNGVVPINKGGSNNSALDVSAGGLIGSDGSKLINIGVGTAGQVPLSNGSSVAWGNNTMTKQILTSTGATAGYVFTITSGNATIGATYTNNAVTYTVLSTIASKTNLAVSGAGAPQSSGTLTKATGSGDATIAFSLATPTAVYTTPANAKLLKVYVTSGGGGSSDITSTAADAAASSGGGGGATLIKYIANPVGTYYYDVGVGGTHTAGQPTQHGQISSFTSGTVGTNFIVAQGGGHGSACAPSTLCITNGAASSGVGAQLGYDILILGGAGGNAYALNGTTLACSGGGGGSFWAGAAAPVCGSNTAGINGGTDSWGQGATGAVNINGGAAANGASGSAGVVVVEEYY